MDLPALYEATNVERLYEVDLQRAFAAGMADFKRPASQDKPRILAWLIDMQVDFVFPAPVGRLPVPNALDDTRRTVEWLYRNTRRITHIAASLDTHTPFQIFYASWWKNSQGEHPAPFTAIPAEAVRKGEWLPTTEPEWSLYYVEQLERKGKRPLTIWPFHCIEGTTGRDLVPALSEAILYHSGARMAQPTYLAKGMIAHTEYYSVLEPEVEYPQHPEGHANTAFQDMLATFDEIYVAGQARSHCVLESVNSVVRYFAARPEIIGKLRFLDDCTSPIPGFEESTEAQLKRFAARGVKFVRSTDEMR